MICTTLNKIRNCSPCKSGWTKLLKHLNKTKADDELLPFSVIVESNGIEDALWCCRTVEGYDKEWRLFAVWCARQVQHLMKDERSISAVDVSERFANGEATKEELDAAWDAAWDAARGAAGYAARAAARAAAGDVAWVATRAAAEATARGAARAAAGDVQVLRLLDLL